MLKTKKWLVDNAISSRCVVQKIPFSQSLEWNYSEKEIKHKSNRFFKIVGVEWKKNPKQQTLLIDQKEIGILGFIFYQWKNKKLILIQAKVEPGNVGLAQIAPSYQATLSNMEQVHGGTVPKFTNLFTQKNLQIISSSLQSEQGTRFLGKRNKNIIISVNKLILALSGYKWIKTQELKHLLSQDYLINTDARSVLVSSNWQQIFGDQIFDQHDVFTQELRKSYYTNEKIIPSEQVLKLLKASSKKAQHISIIPIKSLKNCQINDRAIKLKNKNSFQIIHIKVKTKKREVDKWDQPIIKSYRSGKYVLYSGRKNNILYFCFKLIWEPGLYNTVELGTYKSTLRQGKVIKSCWQSDEGGRFYHDKCKYTIIDIGQIHRIDKKSIWLTLKQIQELCLKDGIFCNEARSAISLILSMS